MPQVIDKDALMLLEVDRSPLVLDERVIEELVSQFDVVLFEDAEEVAFSYMSPFCLFHFAWEEKNN